MPSEKTPPYSRADLSELATWTEHAFIREEACIGCMKCIHACPVDAIIGANRYMHNILLDVCIGCGLCVPPCPVDCIDMKSVSPVLSPEQVEARSAQAIQRHNRQQQRQAHNAQRIAQRRDRVKTVKTRKAAVAAALARHQKNQHTKRWTKYE